MPVIFDEWAHVPCYNTSTLREDPNVRNFWGESIKEFWDKTFESEGVGGAIWGMIDEVFLLPDGRGQRLLTWERVVPAISTLGCMCTAGISCSHTRRCPRRPSK